MTTFFIFKNVKKSSLNGKWNRPMLDTLNGDYPMAIKEIVLTESDTKDIEVMRDIIYDKLIETDNETEGFGFQIVVFINDGEDV